MLLAVVRQSTHDRQCAVDLLDDDHARQLVRQRDAPEGQLLGTGIKDALIETLGPADHECRLLWWLLLELLQTRCELFRTQQFAAPIERDRGPTARRSQDAITLALAHLLRRAMIEGLIFDDDDIKFGEPNDSRLIIGSGFSQRPTRAPDNNQPERDYASGWSSPTSGRSRMLSRTAHLS